MLPLGFVAGVVVGDTALGSIDFVRTVVKYGTCIRTNLLSPYRIVRTCGAVQEIGYLAFCKPLGCLTQNISYLRSRLANSRRNV